jgi:hypothetical protein
VCRDPGAAAESRTSARAPAGEVLATRAQRLTRLRVERDDVLLQLFRLELEPFLGGDDVGDAALTFCSD